MPDVPSVGLGGGSIVSVTEDSGKVHIPYLVAVVYAYIRL